MNDRGKKHSWQGRCRSHVQHKYSIRGTQLLCARHTSLGDQGCHLIALKRQKSSNCILSSDFGPLMIPAMTPEQGGKSFSKWGSPRPFTLANTDWRKCQRKSSSASRSGFSRKFRSRWRPAMLYQLISPAKHIILQLSYVNISNENLTLYSCSYIRIDWHSIGIKQCMHVCTEQHPILYRVDGSVWFVGRWNGDPTAEVRLIPAILVCQREDMSDFEADLYAKFRL